MKQKQDFSSSPDYWEEKIELIEKGKLRDIQLEGLISSFERAKKVNFINSNLKILKR
jgi:hypothetical protein